MTLRSRLTVGWWIFAIGPLLRLSLPAENKHKNPEALSHELVAVLVDLLLWTWCGCLSPGQTEDVRPWSPIASYCSCPAVGISQDWATSLGLGNASYWTQGHNTCCLVLDPLSCHISFCTVTIKKGNIFGLETKNSYIYMAAEEVRCQRLPVVSSLYFINFQHNIDATWNCLPVLSAEIPGFSQMQSW